MIKTFVSERSEPGEIFIVRRFGALLWPAYRDTMRVLPPVTLNEGTTLLIVSTHAENMFSTERLFVLSSAGVGYVWKTGEIDLVSLAPDDIT